MFNKIYDKCKKNKVLEAGGEALISCILNTKDKILVEQTEVASFRKIEGYKVIIEGQAAFFPKSLNTINENSGLDWLRNTFLDIDLVFPPYYPFGDLIKFAADVNSCKAEVDKEKVVSNYLTSMYSEDSIAALCIGVYKEKKALSPFYKHILESVKAYYSGFFGAAITLLIPCIEGIIRHIGHQVNVHITNQINKKIFLEILEKIQLHDIKNIIFQTYNWYPCEEMNIAFFDKFHERIQMVESIKIFIKNAMYHDTRKAPCVSKNLNRHAIIHGLITDFDKPCNFFRLITLLNALSVASIIAGDPGSLFHPELTKESTILGTYFFKIKQQSAKDNLNF